MKISKMLIEKVKIDLVEPFRIAFTTQYFSENYIIKISTDEDLDGYGEAAPLGPVTGETEGSVIAALQLFGKGLIGKDPFDLQGAHIMMDSLLSGNYSAKAAVDMALYDLISKSVGVPVYKYLGGYKKEVITDMTIGLDTVENMVKKSVDYVGHRHFRILKIKAGKDVNMDCEVVQRIRKAVGDEVELRVDANQGYTVKQALYALEQFKQSKISYLEQPLSSWDQEGLAFLKQCQSIPIAADECVHTPRDVMKACKKNVADIINIKLMKCGGIFPALQISCIAEQNGLVCMQGCMLETRLGITAGASVVAARRNVNAADLDSFLYYVDPACGMQGGFTWEEDKIILSDEPGFGLKFTF